jgi:hypothetical protein
VIVGGVGAWERSWKEWRSWGDGKELSGKCGGGRDDECTPSHQSFHTCRDL